MNGLGWQGWMNPWRRLREMENAVGRLLGEHAFPRGAAFPPVNVYTDSEGARVTAELPGVEAKDLDITVHNQTLIVRGERKAPEAGEGEAWHRRERAFGQFARAIDLPFRVEGDDLEATYRDGILSVRLHRAKAERPRQITVKG